MAALHSLITDTSLGLVFVEVVKLPHELVYDTIPEGSATVAGSGGFTLEQAIATQAMWFRFSHTWPPANGGKAKFLT
jgi:hypothetical protein